MAKIPCSCDTTTVFRASKKTKKGKVIFAKWFGKRAFPITVKSKDCPSCVLKQAKTVQ